MYHLVQYNGVCNAILFISVKLFPDELENSSRVGNMAMVRTQHVQKINEDHGPTDADIEYGQMDVRSSKGDIPYLPI